MSPWKILFFVTSSIAVGQEWELRPTPILESIVSVESRDLYGNITGYGTGVVVKISEEENKLNQFKGWYSGKILTAAHINGRIRVRFHNDKWSETATVKEDKNIDVKLIAAFIPPGVTFTPVGKIEDEILVNGLGGKASGLPSIENIRCFSARKIGPSDNLFLDGYVIPGDSGGPIISNGKVVSIVSGGFAWFKDKIDYTFPIRGASNKQLLDFMNVKD